MTKSSDTRRQRKMAQRAVRGHHPRRSELLQTLLQMRAEGGGLVSVQVIRAEDMPELLACAAAGEAEAATLLRCLTQTLRDIEAAADDTPRLCAICPAPLRDGRYSILVARPQCDAPTAAIACAICERCAGDHEQARGRIADAFRGTWPDLRPVIISAEAGHA